MPCTGAAGLVAPAGGAREELVPGAEQRARAVDVDLVRLAAGDQLADRALDHDRLRRPGTAPGRRARAAGSAVSRSAFAAREQQVAVGALGGPAAHALQQPRADLQVVGQLLRAPARRSSLTVTACRQVAHGSLQASTRNVHRPGSSGTTVAANRSVPALVGAIRTCWRRRRRCRPSSTRRWPRPRRGPRARPWRRSGRPRRRRPCSGWRPSPTAGVTSSIPSRPVIGAPPGRPRVYGQTVPTRSGRVRHRVPAGRATRHDLRVRWCAVPSPTGDAAPDRGRAPESITGPLPVRCGP